MARLYLFGHRCLVRDALQALLQQAGQQVVGADADPDVADAELLAAPAELLLADLRWGTAPVQALLQRLHRCRRCCSGWRPGRRHPAACC